MGFTQCLCCSPFFYSTTDERLHLMSQVASNVESHQAFILTATLFLYQQGEQPPLEKIKPSRSRNLEEVLSETDTLVRLP